MAPNSNEKQVNFTYPSTLTGLVGSPDAEKAFLTDSLSEPFYQVLACVEPATHPLPLLQGFVVLSKFRKKLRRGRGWVAGYSHMRLQHLVKWLWERVWDFSALGGPTSSVSRRVVKLTVSHYYSVPLPLQ